MAYTCTTIFGKRLEARMEPWVEPPGGVHNDDLCRLLDAIGQPYQAILELAEEVGEDGQAGYIPAYGKLLDPVTCPFKDLPYLGQFVGVEVPKVAPEAEARELVSKPAGRERGTLQAIEAAIKRILKTGKFTVQERTAKGGEEAAYHFNVLVEPGKNSKALEEAIEAVTPAGVFFSVLEIKNAWLQGAKTWNAIAAGVKWNKPIVEGEY